MKMNSNCISFILVLVLLSIACTDSVDPAGPAQYVNPEYPSELTGFTTMSTMISGGFAPALFYPQTPNLAFSTQDGQTIVVLSKNAGRVYVYSHQ